MSLRALQITMRALGLIPLTTGAVGLLGLADPLYLRWDVVPNAVLDSNLRFYSGFWLAAGIAIQWLVPRLMTESVLFRALWGMIFVGGLGRVASLVSIGAPPIPLPITLGVISLELVGAPLFVLWQWRLEQTT